MTDIILDGRSLTLAEVIEAGRRPRRVLLGEYAAEAMQRSVEDVDAALASEQACYGINTGFGAFANRRIPTESLVQLQYNLARSHACGVGEPLPDEIVRRTILLKANSLARGVSGVRPQVARALVALLNGNVLPVIPARGSVGASGDLAPLAHLALALIGEGEARHGDRLLRGREVTDAAGVDPVELRPKEGLGLLNGTQVTASLAIDGLERLDTLLRSAIIAGALSLEGLAGSYAPFDKRIHEVRNLAGQILVAEQFRSLLTASGINRSHVGCDRVQDPYSVRCMPQVFGAVRDTLAHAAGVLSAECNSVSDNPLIFDGEVLSGGNFHAQPLAFVADFMSIAAAELGSISERRTDLMERKINPKLHMFLTSEPGLESGFMIAHVTAAALASENKTLAHPASIDSIPTSAGQEDHVSMGTWAALKLRRICDNTAHILGIEMLAAARAIDFQRPLTTTPELARIHAQVREMAPFLAGDARLDGDIRVLADAVNSGVFAAQLPQARKLDCWPR